MEAGDLTHFGPARRATKPLAVIAAVVLVGVGLLLGRALTLNADPVPSATTTPSDAPTPHVAGDEAGAVNAATEFARIMPGPSADVDSYLQSMRNLAVPEWRGRAEQLGMNAVAFVHERYGDGGQVEFHPVRYRVQSHSDEAATIDVWGAVLGSGPNLDGIEESWVTGTLHLVWVDSQWLVNGQSSVGGPTPELSGSSDASSAAILLEDFEEYSNAQSL